jgi:tellurite resistance-related uncharacterized protein
MTSHGPELPAGLEYVRTTEVFDHQRHPAGLRRAHRVATGVWARLAVHSGELVFVFEDQPGHPYRVATGDTVAIPPGRRHHLEIDLPVTFSLEFYQEGAATFPDPGEESTGLGPL